MKAKEFISETPLQSYDTIGNFDKQGPFREKDKKLVTHPTNLLKTGRFFEKTPFNFRLFFSNIPGTGKYAEYGVMKHDKIIQIFGEQYGEQIINGSEDAITVVFVGNSGADKVPITPWVMAHRFGHAIQATTRKNLKSYHVWNEAEKHFFFNINTILEDCYNKTSKSRMNIVPNSPKYDLFPEYSALFNAIGTQRSSRQNLIKRPYEFMYEMFAQYLGTGSIKFNPLPITLEYGRKAWGNPTKGMYLKSELRDDEERSHITDILANDMELMFADVLYEAEGNIFVM